MAAPNPDPKSPLGFDMFYGSYSYVDADGNAQRTHDMQPSGRSSSGVEIVESAILHRLTTDLLPLIDSEEDFIEYGEDVRKWLGLAMTQEGLSARAAGLGPVVERDPRVLTADVSGSVTTSAGDTLLAFELSITATLRTGESIDRVMGISDVSVGFLAEGR